MAFSDLQVTEIFHSLQGETSLSGVRFAFIRLTGCNLRCSYCDSAYAFKGGRRMKIQEILDEVRPYQVKHVLLTGGEPLLQRNTRELATQFIQEGYQVSIETHGEVSIEAFMHDCRIIMDIKTPGSRMNRGNYVKNLRFLKPGDEIKFVITSKDDYEFAKKIILSGDLPEFCEILISAVNPAKHQPGGRNAFPGVELRWLSEKILEDRLPVRLQTQLHKLIWGADKTGV